MGRKFTIFALFYFVFESKFQVQVPRGASIWRGDLTDGFFALRFWGAYIWRVIHGGAYYRNFTVLSWTEQKGFQCIRSKRCWANIFKTHNLLEYPQVLATCGRTTREKHCSLRRNRLRLVSEERKTEERDSRLWPLFCLGHFDFRSPFFAPKPHGNACYAG